jgi:uncharacterized protein DUF5753/helix-turn-helix protein
MKDPRARRWLTRSDGLATRLRDARGTRSQAKFAAPLGWVPSKVTRIEQGIQVPTAEDVEAWGREAGLGKSERAQLQAMLEEFLSMKATFRDRMKAGGQADIQQGYNDLTAGATLIRHFQTAWVPGLLQTPAYARAVLEQMADLHNSDLDIDRAVERRLQRRELLYDPTRRFEVILAQPALEWVFVPAEVMREQLHYLQSVTSMPRVRFGIIPTFTPIETAPQTPFVMYDDLVVTENFLEESKATSEGADFYEGVMNRLWRDAVEGPTARDKILTAMDAMPNG